MTLKFLSPNATIYPASRIVLFPAAIMFFGFCLLIFSPTFADNVDIIDISDDLDLFVEDEDITSSTILKSSVHNTSKPLPRI
jgi:hypothetical protein